VHGIDKTLGASDVIADLVALKEIDSEPQPCRLDGGRQAGRAASDNTDPDLAHTFSPNLLATVQPCFPRDSFRTRYTLYGDALVDMAPVLMLIPLPHRIG
jgi:hypothetical protein